MIKIYVKWFKIVLQLPLMILFMTKSKILPQAELTKQLVFLRTCSSETFQETSKSFHWESGARTLKTYLIKTFLDSKCASKLSLSLCN